MICRICGSDKITRSHRRGMEKIFKYVYPRTPYRCKECWSRFWIFENPFKTTLSKATAGFAACILILLISWPFLAFNKKEPVQVEKKESSGSLFLTRGSNTQKPGTTQNDTQEQEDSIASYEDTDPEQITEQTIDQTTEQLTNHEDKTESVPEISVQETETTPETGTIPAEDEIQPDISVSSDTNQLENKTNREIETKSQPLLQFRGLEISEADDSVNILLKTDKPKEKHKYFFISNPAPPRIVIDLPGKWKHLGNSVFKTKSHLISRVRVGKHSDFFRIVLDMKTDKRLFPSFKESPQGLIISIKE